MFRVKETAWAKPGGRGEDGMFTWSGPEEKTGKENGTGGLEFSARIRDVCPGKWHPGRGSQQVKDCNRFVSQEGYFVSESRPSVGRKDQNCVQRSQ